MTTEAKLVAKVETKGAKKSAKELDQFAESAEDAEKSTLGFQKALKAGGAIAAKAVAGLGVAATAMTTIAVKSAQAQREWKTFANIANSSVSEFKAAAFAAESVGISAEKLADISKDTREKLGEFVSTGGGGFKDFFEQVAPLVNLTADELQNLSGPDVLLAVQKAMEDANVPLERQSFLLESIASDTTNLIPLLANEGAELNRLAGSYRELNSALEITGEQQQGLRTLSEEFSLLEQTATSAITFLTAQFSPQLAKSINFWTSAIPVATQKIAEFFDIFRDASEKQTIGQVQDEINTLAKRLFELRAEEKGFIVNSKEFNDTTAKLKELRARYEELNAAARADTVTAPSIPSFSSNSGDTGIGNNAKTQADAFLLQIEAFGASRFEIITIQEQELQTELQNYRDQDLVSLQEFETAKTKITEDANQQRADLTLSTTAEAFGNLSSLMNTENKKLFKIGKAAAIAQATINVAQGITEALKLGPILGPVLATSQAIAGAVQIENIRQQSGNFANGGFVNYGTTSGDNTIANVNRNEAILNTSQQRNFMDLANGKGSGTNIEINNYASDVASATASVNEDGKVIVLINRVLEEQVNNPNSPFSKNMKNNYTLPRSFA